MLSFYPCVASSNLTPIPTKCNTKITFQLFVCVLLLVVTQLICVSNASMDSPTNSYQFDTSMTPDSPTNRDYTPQPSDLPPLILAKLLAKQKQDDTDSDSQIKKEHCIQSQQQQPINNCFQENCKQMNDFLQ